jgi:hypothetical protein
MTLLTQPTIGNYNDTLALWHPNYNTGWAGGYCSLQITCNSPSYDSAADCCKFAYAGQSSNTCYTTAGIPVPTSAPVPGMAAAGTWYPDYPAGWEAGKCINTLPLPPYGSRPLYATQLQCCMAAYAGQTNNFCIANMDGSPTSQYGTQWYPKYDAVGTCTTKLPLPPPGSRSYFASKEECCQGTYDSWGGTKIADCISGGSTMTPTTSVPMTSTPSDSPSASPSVSTAGIPLPTAFPTTSKPTSEKPSLVPSSIPSFVGAGGGSNLSQSPTESPTASPTAFPTTSKPTTASPSSVGSGGGTGGGSCKALGDSCGDDCECCNQYCNGGVCEIFTQL